MNLKLTQGYPHMNPAGLVVLMAVVLLAGVLGGAAPGDLVAAPVSSATPNPDNPCNPSAEPTAGSIPANPCNPCAAQTAGAIPANPCNPRTVSGNPCSPGGNSNPCASGKRVPKVVDSSTLVLRWQPVTPPPKMGTVLEREDNPLLAARRLKQEGR